MDDLPPVLHIFWGVSTSFFGATTIYLMLLRTYWDKNSGSKPSDEKRSWYEFQKRPFQLALFSLVWGSFLALSAVGAYCWDREPNSYLSALLNYVRGSTPVTSDYISTVIALAFFIIHQLMRVYDTWSVNIFSHKQVLNPITFLVPYCYQFAAGLTLLVESIPLKGVDSCVSTDGFSFRHIAALLLFFVASKMQRETFVQFAKLRRNKAGHVVTTDYKMPKGSWFDFCSCPHYFAEILIYMAIGLALGLKNGTWWWAVIFIFTHHFYLGYNTHQYYMENFPNFPKDKYFLIPYVI